MLSTLTVVAACVVVAVVAVVGGGMLYIPSHEANAGDGMNCFYNCLGACV
jgi:hypothetical protein